MDTVTIRPFKATPTTVNLAVLATSANVAVTRPNFGTQTLRLANIGPQTIFVTFGKDNTITSSVTTGFPMIANSVETFQIQNDESYVAAIAIATGSTLYVTTGESA